MDYFLSILSGMELEIPLWQVGIFILLVVIFMLFGKLRLCLVTSYLFTLFWVFILNNDKFGRTHQETIFFTTLFTVSGLLIAFLTIIAFCRDSSDE